MRSGEDPDPAGPSTAALEELGERGLIARLRRQLPPPGPEVLVGIGDDAAAVAWGGETLLLRHRLPTPRVAEGRLIRASGSATAMTDVSDGLVTDLDRIATESRVGARIDVEALPVSETTRAVAEALGRDPLRWALNGGEDYELLFTAAAGRAGEVARTGTDRTGTPVHRIGEVRPSSEGVRFLDRAGHPRAVEPGFDHVG